MNAHGDSAPVATTALGDLEGMWNDGVATFRGVPFAAPPVGQTRFAPTTPPEPWARRKLATEHGPIGPQMSARLAAVMGDYQRRQHEDCLTLTISTPAADGKRRPVMVWIHGGAFMTGAGSLDWYDGAGFARAHDIVFVGLNYRLGAFGWLKIEGLSPGNLGLRDQVAALHWVQRHIAAFGGDPGNVTLAGQSAGAISIVALLANRDTRRLFGRAIIQSGPVSLFPDAAEAVKTGRAFLETAGLTTEQLRTLPVPALLDAQMKLLRATARFGDPAPAFMPFRDGELVPDRVLDAAVEGARDKGILIGWTRDEMSAFFAHDPNVANAPMTKIDEAVRNYCGPADGDALLRLCRQRRPGAGPAQLLDLAMSDATFCGPTVQFAERLAEAGNPAWLYRFDWAAPGNPAGACHCIELPFVFNNFKQWDAPMLKPGDAKEMAALAGVVHKSWAAFVRHGDPNHDGLPSWPRYESTKRATLRFDRLIDVVGDPAGHTLRQSWPESASH